MNTKFIKWKVAALLLSWALLGVGLKVINLTTTQLDRATFGAILIAVAGYLAGTTALLKPFMVRVLTPTTARPPYEQLVGRATRPTGFTGDPEQHKLP